MKIFIKIISLLFFVSIMLALPIIRADKKVELKTIKENITPYINKDTFKEQSLTTLYKNYNIKKEQIEDFISYGPISYISVDEITIIKQPNKEIQTIIQNKLEQYVTKKISTFESYGPKQVELLKAKIIATKGDYIYLIVSKDSIKIKQAIDKLF